MRCFTRGTVFHSEEAEVGLEESDKNDFIDPAKDRRKPIPFETSIRYVASAGKINNYIKFINTIKFR